MNDKLFQQKVLLEFEYLRTRLNECPTRSEMNAEFAAMREEVRGIRTDVSDLRITTAQGFESCLGLFKIIGKRLDRIERHLGLD